MIRLGEAARHLRERLGLSQRAAANQLGISHVHLSNIESGKSSPTAAIIEKYYEAWDIDLYMFAVANFSQNDRIPHPLRGAVNELRLAWDSEIESRIASRQEDTNRCSESKQ